MKKYKGFLAFILVFTSFQHSAYLLGNSPKHRMEIKHIAYSQLTSDNPLDLSISAFYSEAMLSSLNDLGLVNVNYLAENINFEYPDTNLIRNVCAKLDLDGVILSKALISFNFIGSMHLAVKMLDKEGNFVKNESFTYQTQLNNFGIEREIHKAVYELCQNLAKKWNILDSAFPIENITQKTWQSFKYLGKDKTFYNIGADGRFYLRLFNNFGFYWESTPDSSTQLPHNRFDYNSTCQEIVLHYKDDSINFKILGYDGSVLILKSGRYDKLLFRALTDQEIAELSRPPPLDTGQENEKPAFIIPKQPPQNDDQRYNQDSLEVQGPIFFIAEESATFQDGDLNKFREYVLKHTIYPPEAKQQRMSGKAIVQFIVGYDGKTKAVKLIRSSGWKPLDQEALRVISSSPLWKPGKQDGKAVNQLFTMPVSFIFQ